MSVLPHKSAPNFPGETHGLFCEFVRDEIGGTTTLIGVFPPVYSMSKAALEEERTLSAVVWYSTFVEKISGVLRFDLMLPTRRILRADVAVPEFKSVERSGEDQLHTTTRFSCCFQNIRLEREGMLLLRLSWGEYRAFPLRVNIVGKSTAKSVKRRSIVQSGEMESITDDQKNV